MTLTYYYPNNPNSIAKSHSSTLGSTNSAPKSLPFKLISTSRLLSQITRNSNSNSNPKFIFRPHSLIRLRTKRLGISRTRHLLSQTVSDYDPSPASIADSHAMADISTSRYILELKIHDIRVVVSSKEYFNNAGVQSLDHQRKRAR